MLIGPKYSLDSLHLFLYAVTISSWFGSLRTFDEGIAELVSPREYFAKKLAFFLSRLALISSICMVFPGSKFGFYFFASSMFINRILIYHMYILGLFIRVIFGFD